MQLFVMGPQLKAMLKAIGKQVVATVRSLFLKLRPYTAAQSTAAQSTEGNHEHTESHHRTRHKLSWRTQAISLIPALALSGLLTLTVSGCASRNPSIRVIDLPDVPKPKETRKLSDNIKEVAPPAILLDLAALTENNQPNVDILYPKADQVIDETQLDVKLKLRNLPIYKDENLNLGPHLQVILDNQPARSVYSLEEPLTFEALSPGSHTLRVLAVQPWGESFKNPDAYAQTTFHIFAKTGEHVPEPNQPILTYNQPQGTYGAEPVLLDFYLTNAPLHQIARESSQDDIVDWKINCSVNGQSFVFDQWEPIYLKGLKSGQNWIQLTLIDEQGNRIDNAFNSTVRTFSYDPSQRTTLDRIIRGELPLAQIGQIADPKYQPPAEPVLPTEPEPESVAPELEQQTQTEQSEPEATDTELTETQSDVPTDSVAPAPVEDSEESTTGITEEATRSDDIDTPITPPASNDASTPDLEESREADIDSRIEAPSEAGQDDSSSKNTEEPQPETTIQESDSLLSPADDLEPPADEQPADEQTANEQTEDVITDKNSAEATTETSVEVTEPDTAQSSPWQRLRQQIQSTWQKLKPAESTPVESAPNESFIVEPDSAELNQPTQQEEANGFSDVNSLLDIEKLETEESLPPTVTETEESESTEKTDEYNGAENGASSPSLNRVEPSDESPEESDIFEIDRQLDLSTQQAEPLSGIEDSEIDNAEIDALEVEIPEVIEIPNTLGVPDIPSENLLVPRAE